MMPDRSQFRDRSRYAAAVLSEALAPALRAYAATRTRRPRSDPRTWRRGVILGSTHIGDVLYRTCSLEHLRTALPRCRWSYVASPASAEILRGNPAIDEIVTVESDDDSPECNLRTLTAMLREREFDVALCSDTIRPYRHMWLAVMAGVPNRVAFVQKGMSGLATIGVAVERSPWPAQFRRMVEVLSGEPDTSPLRPRVYLDANDENIAAAYWSELEVPEDSLTIAAAVTTRQRVGAFPPGLFADIFERCLKQSSQVRIILAGSAEDAPVLHDLGRRIGPHAVVAAGTLPLRAFAALLRRCDAFMGSDSGPRHIANAAGVPVFFVRNMAVPEIEAGRYCETETDIAPRGQYLSPEDANRALATIEPDIVARRLVSSARASRGSPCRLS